MSGVLAAGNALWSSLRERIGTYLAHDDPLAAAANSGAFIVWGNQPFYPLYCWFLVGHDAWPALLTWLSTPAFFAAPLLARKSSLAGRALFVVAGVANTMLSAKAFGRETDVAWFLLPCLILALGYFRSAEWKAGAGLAALVILAGGALSILGAPLHRYDPAQAQALSRLNIWSVTVLSLYLVYAAIRSRAAASAKPSPR